MAYNMPPYAFIRIGDRLYLYQTRGHGPGATTLWRGTSASSSSNPGGSYDPARSRRAITRFGGKLIRHAPGIYSIHRINSGSLVDALRSTEATETGS